MSAKALLALADGTVFLGNAIGAPGKTVGEVVFNTAMTGYQEILTDPSYCRQIVTLTCPHIGNVGTNDEDEESTRIYAAGLVVRDMPAAVSSWRAMSSLQEYLRVHSVVGIADIDTRKLTRVVRERGAQGGCIMAGHTIDAGRAIELARAFPGLQGMDLAKEVSTRDPYEWNSGIWNHPQDGKERSEATRFHVVAYDFGVKRNILRLLVDRGCNVSVVPATATADEVIALAPDGIFLSNGPGDPEPCDYAIAAIEQFCRRRIPVFGICLGHQLLGLASGAKTSKMKFGHHGANHPVIDLDLGTVMITSQNHGFAVEESTLPPTLRATHRSLFDGSLQGIARTDCPAFSFQGHPEASPGPHDVVGLFDRFVDLMAGSRQSSLNLPPRR